MNKCHQFDIEVESESFFKSMKGNGMRLTKQRKAIVQGILKFGSPFTADELYLKLKKEHIDLVTIYRSLTSFTQMGILSTVDISDGTLRYEYGAGKGHHHHHVVCVECKSIEPIQACTVRRQEKQIEKMGYTKVYHKLEFFGLCKSCAAQLR